MFNRIRLFINSTRFKTTLWYSLIFLTLEIVIGTIIYFSLRSSLYNQLDSSLTGQAELIFHIVDEERIDFYNFIPDSIYSTPADLIYDLAFEAVALNPTNSFIQVKFNDNIIFQSDNLRGSIASLSDTSNNNFFVKDFFDKRLSNSRLRAAVLNEKKYQIITAFPTSHIDNTLESLTDLYVIIAPIFLLISFVGGAFFSVKSLSRIDSIIKRTQFITTQNLEEKIDGYEYDDEYGRLARTMNEMISRIKKSIDYMNQFSISAAHELKTPLTILRGEIELALRSKQTPEEYRATLKSNLDETLRLINIVDKLFFISKTDYRLVKINKERIELNAYMLNVIESMRKIADGKNIQLNFICESLVYAEVDKGLINQVLYNLIENAIKYSDADEVINIRLGRRNGGKSIISVTDKGEYIPPELQNKIFEKFYRLETSRNRDTGGAGLGLSVVRSIIEMHGGTIEVESLNDGLTTFTVII